jgi:3-hydroxyisobutyrate dehydrogenase and related beta-hydroxyacid dehydrogenases
MKVGLIGFGNLGSSIAKRLSSCGVEVVVYNRTKSKVKDFKTVDYPYQLLEETEIIIINVFDSLASKEVIFGEHGLVKGDIKSKIVVDTTTNHYNYVKEAYENLKNLGAYYLDAPVLGSVIPALKGELVMLIGGDEGAFKKAEDILKLFTKERIYLGAVPNGTYGKLLNNIVLGMFMDAISQSVGIGESIGFSKETVLKILELGAGNSYILNVKREKLLKEDFSPHFSVKAIYKDLHYAQELLKDFKLSSFSMASVREMYGLAVKNGLEDLDFSAILKLYKK